MEKRNLNNEQEVKKTTFEERKKRNTFKIQPNKSKEIALVGRIIVCSDRATR